MKNLALCVTVLFSISACDESMESNIDASVNPLAQDAECIRYVDDESVEKQDGLSWETAFSSIEIAIESIDAYFEETGVQCELWVKEGTDLSYLDEYEGQASKNINMFNAARNSRTTATGSGRTTPNGAVGNRTASDIKSVDMNRNISETIDRDAKDVSDSLISNYDKNYTIRADNTGDTYTVYSSSISKLRMCTDSSCSTDGGWWEYNPTRGSLEQWMRNNGSALFSMAIDKSTGYVGIGTQYPGNRLEVRGADNDGSSASLEITSGTQHILLDGNEIDCTSGSLHINHNSNNNTYINPTGGNVGIGQASASHRLTVGGDTKLGGKLVMNGGVLTGRGSDRSASTLNIGTENLELEAEGRVSILDGFGNRYASFDSNTNRFKLAGTIEAQEIILEAVVQADYVFQEGYDLWSLEEVEDHINENNHLPGVPSERDVDEHGLSMGDFNVLLLQKIEELTLYTIEQQKEINKLKASFEIK